MAKAFEPSIPQLHAYKVVHHADYLEKTAAEAGGTNVLLHTKTLPTEGTDPVVTPALDHLYTKAVVDLTNGPVVITMPEVPEDRYFSIMVTDQEHYVIYEEIRPAGRYVFVHDDWSGEIPDGQKINNRSLYPHVFIRTQVKTPDDLPNTLAIQDQISIEGEVGTLGFEDPIAFTLDTHNVYGGNQGILEPDMAYSAEDHQRMFEWAGEYFATSITDNTGMFGPIDSNEPGSNDPRVRAAAIVGHLGLPVHHAFYTGIFNNCDGELLNGSSPYKVTLPYENAVSEFWSITRYSALTRNTLPDRIDVYNAYNTSPNDDGNIIVTFSAEAPNDGTYWMPVNEGEPYYYVERFYGPDIGNVEMTLDFCS
ncbi:DUF1254 domain-containing protein [Parasedimentitalea denitrificans]|nr:DUF1254 domain-containing protein [Sedimentitalea sp. CY04]